MQRDSTPSETRTAYCDTAFTNSFFSFSSIWMPTNPPGVTSKFGFTPMNPASVFMSGPRESNPPGELFFRPAWISAGVKAGDRLDSVKDTSLDSLRDVARAFGTAGVGDKIELTVERGGEKKTFGIKLGGGL